MAMFEKLEKDMRMAHMTQEPKKYFTQALTQAICFAVGFTVILFLILHVIPIEITFIKSIPEWILFMFFSGVIPVAAFLLTFFTPKLRVISRRSKINLNLPYAITYMQAMSTTVTLYNLFRSVYEAKDLYGEVSAECGVIVREVEMFGNDIITAVEKAMELTPSDHFRELLNDLLLIYRTGGDMHDFFDAKSEYYRELSRNALDSLLEFLEMIAEVYVTAFVAGPIALIIIIVAQNISGKNGIGNLMPILYIGLPVAAIILISILYILLPEGNIGIIHKPFGEREYPLSIINRRYGRPSPSFLQKLNKRIKAMKLKEALHHPFLAFGSNYTLAAVIGVMFAVIVGLLWFAGLVEAIFPIYTAEVGVCLIIIMGILPLSVAYEIRNHYIKKYEKQLPGLLREISDMRDVGMSLKSSIQMVAEHTTGALATEVKVVSEEVNYGTLLASSLVRMEERIGLLNVKRAITLLVRASEVTDYLTEILHIAITDQEHYLKMKNKRFNVAFIYLAIIYLSIGIYLFTAFELNVAFVGSFDSLSVTVSTGNSVEQMFVIGIILATASGLMAGQLSVNTMLSGLKHTIIMLIMTIITFVFIIGVRA